MGGTLGGYCGELDATQSKIQTIPTNKPQMLIISQNVKKNIQNNLSNQKTILYLYQ
jgi:hypothetical protein